MKEVIEMMIALGILTFIFGFCLVCEGQRIEKTWLCLVGYLVCLLGAMVCSFS